MIVVRPHVRGHADAGGRLYRNRGPPLRDERSTEHTRAQDEEG
jgi:hypothetical protein